MHNSALDYLRLGTWDMAEYPLLVSSLMQLMPGKWEQSKWLQYHGWKNDVLFIGVGEQKKQRHGIVNISGPKSNDHYNYFLEWESLYCTRIDLQITVRQPENVHLDEVYARIKNHVKSSLIQSEQNDTLYVGARTSAIFTRLYEKILDTKYLRLEYEVKGLRARGCWDAMKSGEGVGPIFMYYLKKSKLPLDIKDLFRLSGVGSTACAMLAEIQKDDAKTLKWLQSIDGAIMRALNNHNIGSDVSVIVESWGNYSANLDRFNEEG